MPTAEAGVVERNVVGRLTARGGRGESPDVVPLEEAGEGLGGLGVERDGGGAGLEGGAVQAATSEAIRMEG